MKRQFTILVFALLFFSSAYTQRVVSLNALFTEQDAVLVPQIEGTWEVPAFDMVLSIKRAGDNFYHVTYDEGTTESQFEAVVVEIQDGLILDLRGIFPSKAGGDLKDSFIPIHTFYKLRFGDGTLELFDLSYSWFFQYATTGTSKLTYNWTSNGMLLTMGTGELQHLLADHMGGRDFFNDPLLLRLKHAEDIDENPDMESGSSSGNSVLLAPPNCIPEFPLKDGWLGGDGDVSVPLDSNKVLFLFSDTYVGSRDQQSRQEGGMQMVSNSVGIMNCLPGAETNMKYYWSNMYTEAPGPIFNSNTDRYRYWIPDAFMAQGNLYVVLVKVGPRLAAAPDDIFNFELLGYTLAKVTNPLAPPSHWRIEYIPLPDFEVPHMSYGCHAKTDDYIYFFVNRNENAQLLVRKAIDLIDKQQAPFEYFSVDKTWKEGIQPNDMDTVIHGFRCNTVKYHPDAKQWVMICDIWFMDNKIKMRTSESLTGPWSEEKVLYEIPEVTPGNALYSENNFCYLAREYMQYQNGKRRGMLITYDINNTRFEEIIANPEIYAPRVIFVPYPNGQAN